MKEMLEVFVALIAATGLLLLGAYALGRLLCPVGRGEVWVVVPAAGAGETLEHTLTGLSWLRRAGLLRCQVVVLDRGLTPDGVALAEHLAEEAQALFRREVEEIPAP